ncbi:hypothetical protein PHLCEN_2v360 [Hermanssonia centrifuga]|uniref:Alpha-type protein kinase domain-containing protein n=1 Tax=Hermanssonia centrifuga TaxID=98765 RepID=A0A2R6S6C9_9APHY|nr:hypothetical protein PHLCEN_2v360 [Hermanssonia centrifuga]
MTNCFIVELFVDASSHIGSVRSFKTAHNASFKPPLPESDTIQQLNSSNIIAKRLFIHQRLNESKPQDLTQPPRVKRVRMKAADELPRMLDEANCLFWGVALMRLVYDFVDHKLGKMSNSFLDGWDVPRLRFVLSGLAIPLSDTDAVYLIEERIPDTFTKYMINSSLKPMPNLDSAAMYIAEFLCFAQHVQYLKSEQRVFLSDFQGMSSDLNEYEGNFGAGNLSNMLKRFELEHQCNEFCEFFDLDCLVVADQQSADSESDDTTNNPEPDSNRRSSSSRPAPSASGPAVWRPWS